MTAILHLLNRFENLGKTAQSRRCRHRNARARSRLMSAALSQNKEREIAFFDGHAASNAYDVFTPATIDHFIDFVTRLGGFAPRARIADLGCGSGVFTSLLQRRGFDCIGVDLSPKLIRI